MKSSIYLDCVLKLRCQGEFLPFFQSCLFRREVHWSLEILIGRGLLPDYSSSLSIEEHHLLIAAIEYKQVMLEKKSESYEKMV